MASSNGAASTKRKSFKLDNSALAAKTSGLSYRFSKDLHDKKQGRLGPDDLALWGTVIEGHDAGDGWVRIGDKYLPKTLNGHNVVFEHGDATSDADASGPGGTFQEQASGMSTVARVYNGAKDIAKGVAGDPVKRRIAGSAVGGGIVGGAAGGTVGATAGGVVGGTVGLVGAPFTLGLSIPIGAVVGGGLGLGAGAIAGGSTGMAVGGAIGYRISKNTSGLTLKKEQDGEECSPQ